MNKLLKAFTRTKRLKQSDYYETSLSKYLSTLDLTALAISGTIGSGIYVLTGEVARRKAGPSIILSFAMAFLASILCGLCYAEFGARLPKAGMAYIYSYVTIGELCAFVIGWNLVLEYIVGTAATARMWSSFSDALVNNGIRGFMGKIFGTISVPLLSKYPDLLAFLAVIVVVVIVATGVNQSIGFNWFILILNVVIIIFITIAGLFFADLKNWSDFFPFGFRGVMAGAALLFYSFVGFDVVGSYGDEAISPRTSTPTAIIACLVFSLFAYLGIALSLTLMVPYYELTEYISIANAFEKSGFPVGKYFVAMGAMFALLSGITAKIFPLPQILCSMATDRVIFGFLGRINERTGTPLVACIVSGLLAALMALLLDVISLVELLSIGTLLAYTIVALCVLLLRYRPDNVGIQIDIMEKPRDDKEENSNIYIEMESVEGSSMINPFASEGLEEHMKNDKLSQQLLNQNDIPKTKGWTSFYERLIGWRVNEPTEESYSLVKTLVAVFLGLSITLECCLIYGLNSFASQNPILYALVVFLLLSILFIAPVIAFQPQSKNELTFKVPLVPVVPLLSIFMNIYLILMLSFYTWIRFSVWMTLGMSIYLFYGVKHSKENPGFSEDATEARYTKLNDVEEISPGVTGLGNL